MAVEVGNQAKDWFSGHLMEQLPSSGIVVLPIDNAVWLHPSPRTLDGLVYEPSRQQPKASTRLAPAEKAVEIGVTQAGTTCQQHGDGTLFAIVGDSKCGNHRFFGPLRDESCAAVAPLWRDRVLDGPPQSYW